MKRFTLLLLLVTTPAFAQGIITPPKSGGSSGGAVTPNSCASNTFANGLADSSGTLNCASVPVAAITAIPTLTFVFNATGGTAAPGTSTLSAAIDAALGSTRGAILERGASGWVLLTPGTSGFCFTSNGAAADPSYQSCGSGGSGTVTSVSWTGGLISVATPTTTPAFTIAGTSGGVPYFNSSSTWLSSAALTANLPVIGGGAGSAPTVGTRSGNTTKFATVTGSTPSGDCAQWDASGNIVDAGGACTTGGSGADALGTYLVQTATHAPANAQVMGSLGTGIVKNTTSTGVQSIATAGTDYAAATTGSANTPLFNNGSGGFTNGTRNGSTTVVATVTGSFTTGHCIDADGSGNIQDAGAACGPAPSGSANTPLFNNGSSGFTNGTRTGNTTAVATTTGSFTSGNCVQTDSNHNLVDAGAACGSGGSGTVTSVSFTGGLISVATATTTPAFTVAGTSGGIPYFSASSTWASSGALTANLPVFGGGAGSAPIVGTRSGNTTEVATVTGSLTSGNCIKSDASGNLVDAATTCGGGGGGTIWTVSAKSANFTAACTTAENLYFVTTSTSTITATLPAATSTNCEIVIKKIDSAAGTVSIARAGSDLIDGLTAQTITAQYAVFSLVPDAVSNWWIR